MDIPDLFANRPAEISLAEATHLLEHFGVQGKCVRLSSERDENIRVIMPGAFGYILKISNPAERADSVVFENQVLTHLRANAPSIPTPRVVPTKSGRTEVFHEQGNETRVVRLLTYLQGQPIAQTKVSAQLRLDIGQALASLELGLKSVDFGMPSRELLWDGRHALKLRGLADDIKEIGLAKQIRDILNRFECSGAWRDDNARASGPWPSQILHNDFNPHNLLVSQENTDRLAGIIDFGDMIFGPRVLDVATAAAYWVAEGDAFDAVGDLIAGFHRVTALSESELGILPLLIEVRLAMTILITEWRAHRNEANRQYITRNQAAARQGLARLTGSGASELRHYLEHRLARD